MSDFLSGGGAKIAQGGRKINPALRVQTFCSYFNFFVPKISRPPDWNPVSALDYYIYFKPHLKMKNSNILSSNIASKTDIIIDNHNIYVYTWGLHKEYIWVAKSILLYFQGLWKSFLLDIFTYIHSST